MSMEVISREAVLKLFATHDGKYLYEAIRELPIIKAEPKTHFVEKSNFDIRQYNADLQNAYDCGKASQELKQGHWIKIGDRGFGWSDTVICKCSECEYQKEFMGKFDGHNLIVDTERADNYCPNCGCRMKSEEER